MCPVPLSTLLGGNYYPDSHIGKPVLGEEVAGAAAAIEIFLYRLCILPDGLGIGNIFQDPVNLQLRLKHS